MTDDNTETPDGRGTERGDDEDLRSRAEQVASTVANRDRSGLAAIVAGIALLAWTVRTARRNRGRAVIQALVGVALLGLGLRQRRSGGAAEDAEIGSDADETEKSAEAAAHLEQSDVLHQSETNPRGTSGEPEVETETDPDEGSIQFTDEQENEPGSTPTLDEEGVADPRRDEGEEAVEVDLSEASMADEASEAAGPSPEQAQPASTEGTEPEPTPAEDVSHVEVDEPDSSLDAESDDVESEAGGSSDEEGGANEPR